jgi:anti-anti-sigma factor
MPMQLREAISESKERLLSDMTGLNIEVIERNGSLVLAVDGELDLATSPLLDEELERAEAREVARIVVDLGGVGFIDSTALSVLARHAAVSDRGGRRLRIANTPPQAMHVFEVTGMLEHLPFLADESSPQAVVDGPPSASPRAGRDS